MESHSQNLRDADPDIGARLEVFAAGSYVWIPFEHLTSIEMGPPQRLRDTLWAPAVVQAASSFQGMDLGEVLIPAIYPFSWKHPDEAVWLGRVTDWAADDEGREYPSGQKILLVDGEEIPFLEVRSIEFAHATDGPTEARKLISGPGTRIPMPLREDILAPIPGENPSGIDLRYDTKLLIHDKIKEARRQDDELAQGDWKSERKTSQFSPGGEARAGCARDRLERSASWRRGSQRACCTLKASAVCGAESSCATAC